MTWAVNVRVVTIRRLVFHVRRVDRDATPNFDDKTVAIAAVSVVLPWSTWPIVPTFTCGLVRSNLPFAILFSFKKNDLLVGSGAPVAGVPLVFAYLPLVLMIASVTFFGASA
jgi:hypothetical protein